MSWEGPYVVSEVDGSLITIINRQQEVNVVQRAQLLVVTNLYSTAEPYGAT